jgi:plasmid maintenance system antidote protein VapI
MVTVDATFVSRMSHRQVGTNMPMLYPTRFERKALLVKQGVTMAEVAQATKVHPSFVSRVIAGTRGVAGSEDAVRVMEYVAKKVGASVSELWPSAT